MLSWPDCPARPPARAHRTGSRLRYDSHPPTGPPEIKAPVALAPHPEVRTPAAEDAVSVGPTQATVTAITAVTGTVDEVGDVTLPGAFMRSLASRSARRIGGTCRSAASCRGPRPVSGLSLKIESYSGAPRSRTKSPFNADLRRAPRRAARILAGIKNPGRDSSRTGDGRPCNERLQREPDDRSPVS